MKDILNEKEKNAIRKLIDNKVLMGALKKVLLSNIYYNGTLKKGEDPEPRRNFILTLLYSDASLATDFNMSDERLGQKARASIEAIRLLEQGFAELENLKEIKAEEKEEENPAR
jgi:hypothetical protein